MATSIIIALGLIITPANSGSKITHHDVSEEHGSVYLHVDDRYECEVSKDGAASCADMLDLEQGSGQIQGVLKVTKK